MNHVLAILILTLLATPFVSLTASAHSAAEHAQHEQTPIKPAMVAQENTVVQLADVQLTDQNGKGINLKRDLVSDRIVVMGFIYTSCTTVCPVVSSIMARVHKQLGDKVGREVQIVSITVDPQRDNPQRLLSYASKFQAGPGWSWLTGSQQAINDTLKGLGTWTPDPQNHPPLILVGDGRSNHWTRFYGFADPAQLIERVEQLRADRVSKPVKNGVYVMGEQP